MDAISYALAEVKDRIPPQVLKLVFRPQARTLRHESRNIDHAIRDKVIEGRVRRVVNSIGATEVEIPLDGIERQEVNRFTHIYKIPMTLTGGREITSPVALSYATNSAGHMSAFGVAQSSNNNQPTVMENAAMRLGQSHSPIPTPQTANLSLIAMNTVMVEDYAPIATTTFLRCILASDSDFNNIKPPYYPKFAQLVLLATKAYIFNVYEVELGMGKIINGVELSEIKNVVERYSNADEDFEEYVENTWRKVSIHNDPKRHQRMIRALV